MDLSGSIKKGKIIEFSEKKDNTTGPGLVNAGVYLFSKSVLALIPPCVKYSLEYEVFPKIEGIYGFVSREAFIDIGTSERYEKAKTVFIKK